MAVTRFVAPGPLVVTQTPAGQEQVASLLARLAELGALGPGSGPTAADKSEAAGNAEAVFRYLARVVMPREMVGATLLAWDRNLMERLENVETRASLLTEQEVDPRDPVYGLTPAERHWSLTPDRVQLLASTALKGKRATIQSRPTRPLPPKLHP